MRNLLCALAAIGFLSCGSLASAQEAKAAGKNAKGNPAKMMVTQFLKQLEPAELTAEQKGKVEEKMAAVAKEVFEARKEAGIGPEVMKKRTEAQKAAREAGKKGAEMKASVEEAMGLTDDQKKVFTESEAKIAEAKIAVGKMLTEEQMAKLKSPFKDSLVEKAATPKKKKKSAE